MKHDDAISASVIPTCDSTDGHISGIDSKYMGLNGSADANAENSLSVATPNDVMKAALYARVSTDKQREEATIESQIAEWKKQIAAAGHTLVKAYIDDGHSGVYLDRPALDELRTDLKTDVFDVVYFLCADRIAREPVYQRIIVSELLTQKNRIIISGKDYEENPENKFALTVLGAVAELSEQKSASA